MRADKQQPGDRVRVGTSSDSKPGTVRHVTRDGDRVASSGDLDDGGKWWRFSRADADIKRARDKR